MASEETDKIKTDDPVKKEERASIGDEIQAKTSSTSVTATGGPDSDAGSVDELPVDDGMQKINAVTEDISHKMSAGANYLGSFINTAWSKTAKTASDATSSSSSFISSAFTKVTGSNESKSTQKEEEGMEAKNDEKKEEKRSDETEEEQPGSFIPASATNLFNSAFGSFGFGKGSASSKNEEEANQVDTNEAKDSNEGFLKGGGFAGFSSAFSTIGSMAANATHTFKERVEHNSIMTEFNKEQESFIKSKGNSLSDVGVPPWVGYQCEEELKAKILSLSKDKRNFIRAPPAGVTFDFDYASVAPTAKALLQEDPELKKMRYEVVPKKVKEEEFWRNYFYRVSLIKQSFDLQDMERTEVKKEDVEDKGKAGKDQARKETGATDEVEISHENDEEFVSESYQASNKDIAEANESMKKLGVVSDNPEEWEAELEGELNEFEVVSGKDEDNPEWENQIEEMLEAEENLK